MYNVINPPFFFSYSWHDIIIQGLFTLMTNVLWTKMWYIRTADIFLYIRENVKREAIFLSGVPDYFDRNKISSGGDCPACRTTLIATRFWVVMICPIIKCLTVLEFSFILFDLCLFITIFNFILNYVPIVTFWIFTYHKIWILLIIFCFIWSYWIIYFLTCLEVFWSVVS